MVKLRMRRMVPMMIETTAFNRASPGRLIHREKFGLIKVARPMPMIITPMMGRMIESMAFNGLFEFYSRSIGKDFCCSTHHS